MTDLRIAVIGAGHLGTIHTRLLSSLDHVQLTAVVDPAPDARERITAEFGVPALAEHASLRDRIDAAVIATPTEHHYDVAADLLDQGIHLLIEKPVTTTVVQANRLVAQARARGCVLQVGHVERFNAAWNGVRARVQRPSYIEAVRVGPYTFRSTDVSIVLDLMIHDLDLILSLVNSPVAEVEAMGMALFSPHEDLAHARLKFENGCIANLNASRVSYQAERTMRIFSPHGFAAIDFATGSAELVRPSPLVAQRRIDLTTCAPADRPHVQQHMFEELLPRETITGTPVNAILEEQREFVAAVTEGKPVRVSGEQGRDALAVAERIVMAIRAHRWNGSAAGPIGPHAVFEIDTPPKSDTLPRTRAA